MMMMKLQRMTYQKRKHNIWVKHTQCPCPQMPILEVCGKQKLKKPSEAWNSYWKVIQVWLYSQFSEVTDKRGMVGIIGLPMLPILKKASFQWFGSGLLVNIPFWCWDPALAHPSHEVWFMWSTALTTTQPPCSASSLLPINVSILIYVSPLHCLPLFTLLKCDFIGLNRFYEAKTISLHPPPTLMVHNSL